MVAQRVSLTVELFFEHGCFLGAAQAFIMFAVSLAIYLAVIGVGRATGLVPKRRKAKKAEV